MSNESYDDYIKNLKPDERKLSEFQYMRALGVYQSVKKTNLEIGLVLVKKEANDEEKGPQP